MFDYACEFIKLMAFRRQMSEKTATTNVARRSLSAKKCLHRRQFDANLYVPKSPQNTSDSETLDSNGMSLDHDPKVPLGPLDPIDDCVGYFAEKAHWGLRPLREEEENTEASNNQTHSPSPLIACALSSPIDHLFMESLLYDVPSWKRSLLLHCTWYFLGALVLAEVSLVQTIPKTTTNLFLRPSAPPNKDSEHIAVEMIAIDGRHNGWRYIVLPMAHADELVMSAVLAVSAFHRDINQNKGHAKYCLTGAADSWYPPRESWVGTIPSPQALYDMAIEGLRQRSNLVGSSPEAKQAILVAVLVLLVAAMVTGREDYSTILGMLCSATNVFGGERQLGACELGGFLVRQVRK